MWVSLEILVPEKANDMEVNFKESDLTVIESSPPLSHREDSSLWQSTFDRLGGTLFHLGDPLDIKVRNDRYYLYDAFDWSKSGATFVKFLPKYESIFEYIIIALCELSVSGEIVVSLDVWLGPNPREYRLPIALDDFFASCRGRGLRKNSLRKVVRRPGSGELVDSPFSIRTNKLG